MKRQPWVSRSRRMENKRKATAAWQWYLAQWPQIFTLKPGNTLKYNLPLLVDSVLFGDELVHQERHSLGRGRQLLVFAAVGVSEVDDVLVAWTDVSHCGLRCHCERDDRDYKHSWANQCDPQPGRKMHTTHDSQPVPIYKYQWTNIRLQLDSCTVR